MAQSKLILEVSGGVDHGARIELGGATQTLGRARDCDLVLRDVAVSRRHALVFRTETGRARLETCPGASPAVAMGRTHSCLELEAGAEVLLGNTTIMVRSPEAEQTPTSVQEGSEVQTVLTGVGIDAWHLSALNTLIEVVDRVDDVAELESALREWCVRHAMASDASISFASGSANDTGVTEKAEADGTVTLSVPTDGSTLLTFSCRATAGRVPDTLRRAIVMAGRLFASALARTRRLRVVVDENTALRVMSFGSARAFLGSSPAATQLSCLIPRLSASDVNVLLEGETGSGKPSSRG